LEEDLVTDSHSPSRAFGNPEELLIQQFLHRALESLPVRFREMLVLRELEGMSYKEISTVMDVPTGTVMSTLSRARVRLRQSIDDLMCARPEPDLSNFGESAAT
jgi:RNA polymerase sigma-70 factor (ECF subfamily)